MSDYSSDLIFGKDKTENIVSIEVDDDLMYLFIEKDGKVTREVRPHQFWLLTENKISSKLSRLEGQQHYKWIAQFNTQEEWLTAKNKCKRGNHDYYSVNESKEHALIYNGMTYFKGMKPQDVSVLFFDIEGLGFAHDDEARVTIITNVYRNSKGELTRKNFFLDDYNEDQAQMLEDWCAWVREVDPSIVAVHNGFGYDFQYLNHVAELHNMFLNLGRNGKAIQFAPYTSFFRKDGSQQYEYTNCWIHGREVVDTFFLSLKYDVARNFPSYGLKAIIKHLGKEKTDRVFVDASKMKQYWHERHSNPEMWSKVKEYAIQDADDLIALYDLMMPSFFYFTQSVSKPLQGIINSATGSQINNVLVRGYLQEGHSIAKASELNIKVEGGISFAIPGLYKNLVKIDIKSCYPSQILRFKLYDKNKDPDAYFYNMVKYFTEKRFELKKLYKETGQQYYKDMDSSSKIFINSAYGVTNAGGLNYNSPELAQKITFESREVLNQALIWASQKDKEYWYSEFYKKTGKEENEDED